MPRCSTRAPRRTYVAGLLQVNVTVPTSIDFGNLVPLMLNVGSFCSQLDVTIALK